MLCARPRVDEADRVLQVLEEVRAHEQEQPPKVAHRPSKNRVFKPLTTTSGFNLFFEGEKFCGPHPGSRRPMTLCRLMLMARAASRTRWWCGRTSTIRCRRRRSACCCALAAWPAVESTRRRAPRWAKARAGLYKELFTFICFVFVCNIYFLKQTVFILQASI